jgi:hypothetical protein
MWNFNQFKNLPRNRDLTPAEQSRQYFIYQSNMMYEASINTVAAAAAAAGSGGGSFKTPINEYPFATIQLRYVRFDFFDDARFAPTPAELAAYPNIPAEILTNYSNKQEAEEYLNWYYREVQNEFKKRQFDLLKKNSYTGFFNQDPGPALPYLKGTDQYPLNFTGGELYTEPTTLYSNVFFKGPMALIEVPASPKRLGYYVSTFKEPIADYEDLPTEGNELGDIRYAYYADWSDFILFAWDGLEWRFGDDGYYEDQQTTFRAKREEYAKQLNEVLLSSKPFVWAAEYLPGYRLDKETVFGFDVNDYVFSGIIGENETITLSMNNIEDMASTFRQTTNALLTAVYRFYREARFFLTLEYRKELTELYNQFEDKMHDICEFSDDWYITNITDALISTGPYWQAMIDGNEYLTYSLRPAYVKNLKDAMKAVKSLIEFASGSPIVYTTN